jgi:hypothetical protein
MASLLRPIGIDSVRLLELLLGERSLPLGRFEPLLSLGTACLCLDASLAGVPLPTLLRHDHRSRREQQQENQQDHEDRAHSGHLIVEFYPASPGVTAKRSRPRRIEA